MLGNVHFLFLKVLDTHLVKVRHLSEFANRHLAAVSLELMVAISSCVNLLTSITAPRGGRRARLLYANSPPPSLGHGCFSFTPLSQGSATRKHRRYGNSWHRHSYRGGFGSLRKRRCGTNRLYMQDSTRGQALTIARCAPKRRRLSTRWLNAPCSKRRRRLYSTTMARWKLITGHRQFET